MNKQDASKWTVDGFLKYPIAAIFLVLIWALGYTVEQSDFYEISLYLTVFFALFLFTYRQMQEESSQMVQKSFVLNQRKEQQI